MLGLFGFFTLAAINKPRKLGKAFKVDISEGLLGSEMAQLDSIRTTSVDIFAAKQSSAHRLSTTSSS